METLGGRKPSELLAYMWELYPAEQHNNIFFTVLFLQRLPRDIRVLHTHEDYSNLCLLARVGHLLFSKERSDLCVLFHSL